MVVAVPVRVFRNPYTRHLYEGLASVGVTGARMIEYVADARTDTGTAAHTPDGIDVEVADGYGGADVEGAPPDLPIPAEPTDDERVVLATTGDVIGRALVGDGDDTYVETLGKSMSFDGAYIRKAYVDGDHRGRGVAKGLVAEAVAVAASGLGEARASALIAPDNIPSRRVFEANGFEPVRRHDYLRVLGLEYRRTEDI